ncbi:MAG: hypothetical protein AB8G22_29325 [Saprospiraceae bacterium]
MQIVKLLGLFLVFNCCFSNALTAQTETEVTKTDKQVVIITKTKDADGKEVVKKIVKEGESVSDEELEKMINQELSDKGVELKKGEHIEKEIEEEVTVDENGKTTTTRRVKMKVHDEKVKHEEREVVIKEGQQLEMKQAQSKKKVMLEIGGEADEKIDLGDGTELIIKQKAGSKKKTITIIVEEN